MSTELAVQAHGLTRRYAEVEALRGLDLEVRRGEVFGLLGPNGAGKTTAVRLLAALDEPSAGSIQVLGIDVLREPQAVRRRLGYVPQELSADKYLTARENLRFFCDLYHLARPTREQRIAELLELLGLVEAADRRVRTFSGGMKKKLDLACGLVHRPELLILDEPSLGLDVQVRRAVWDHVLALREQGTTVLLCTNYMDEADRLCDRLAIIDSGRIAASGTPAELRAGLGGDVVTVELEKLEALEAARAVLDALPIRRASFSEERRIHVTVEANETALPRILEALGKASVGVRAVSYHRPGLEEVFLSHVGRRYEPGQAAAGPAPKRR